MYLIVSNDDLARLKPETVTDLLVQLNSTAHNSTNLTADIPVRTLTVAATETKLDFEDVVDLNAAQVADLVDGVSEKFVDGLRLFAEHGPLVDVELLFDSGIEKVARFQAAITRRTRTITGNRAARLLAWDEWRWDEENGTFFGHYAVTQVTYLALREVFELA